MHVEDQRSRWFVLSAEYGLLEPCQVVGPYDLYLPDAEPPFRAARGTWVVEDLRRRLGSLQGTVVEVHAGEAYVDAIRGPLEKAGAQLLNPLQGLRLGERLAWYDERANVAKSEVAGDRTRGVSAPAVATYPDERARDRSIAGAILHYRAQYIDRPATPVRFCLTPEADQFLSSTPFAFLIGVLFDEGIVAERAWQAPYELMKRLGHLDPWRLRYETEPLRRAIAQPPALHRYVSIMADSVARASDKLCREYGGDANRIRPHGTPAAEVYRRLDDFYRIGQKKAAMAVELLVTRFGVRLEGLQGSDVANDVLVRRVFHRTGLAATDSASAVLEAARRLSPDRPGLLDLPTWFIGREWCHPTAPDCASCVLNATCRKRLEQKTSAASAERTPLAPAPAPAQDDSDPQALERQFHQRMVGIYERARSELGYQATYFLQMLSEVGGVEAARRLVPSNRPSDGFLFLAGQRRLDLTAEHLVVDPVFSTLFDDRTVELAQQRLLLHRWG